MAIFQICDNFVLVCGADEDKNGHFSNLRQFCAFFKFGEKLGTLARNWVL